MIIREGERPVKSEHYQYIRKLEKINARVGWEYAKGNDDYRVRLAGAEILVFLGFLGHR